MTDACRVQSSTAIHWKLIRSFDGACICLITHSKITICLSSHVQALTFPLRASDIERLFEMEQQCTWSDKCNPRRVHLPNYSLISLGEQRRAFERMAMKRVCLHEIPPKMNKQNALTCKPYVAKPASSYVFGYIHQTLKVLSKTYRLHQTNWC